MLTNPDKNVTAAAVEAELAELEHTYRARKRTLRALLAVLQQEAGDEPKE